MLHKNGLLKVFISFSMTNRFFIVILELNSKSWNFQRHWIKKKLQNNYMYCNNIITTITISLFQLIFHRILPILKSKLKVHICQSKRFGGFNTWEFINFFQEASHISFKVSPPPKKLKWLFKLRIEEPETCGFLSIAY